MEALKIGTDTLFILLGAIMVLAMHSGFAFLELGTVRRKNQVNALVKILCDFAVSTMAYFFVGYSVAYGVDFFAGAEKLLGEESRDFAEFAVAEAFEDVEVAEEVDDGDADALILQGVLDDVDDHQGVGGEFVVGTRREFDRPVGDAVSLR